MRSSKAAFDLIVAQEVTNRATYEKKYRRPEWPGASSGATVGIGYDLGQTAADTIRLDWSGKVPPAMLDAMVSASGHTGTAGKTMAARIRSKVDIPWEAALAVHEMCVLPRWEGRVAAALPNADMLPPDCFGALVSLTFNRGPSFNKTGDRYREMRAIKVAMAAKRFDLVPAELRSMKRLWPDLRGLRDRREAEAKLFERGLKAAPASSAKPAAPVPKPTTIPAAKETGSAVAGTSAAVAAHQAGVPLWACIVGGVVVATVIYAAIKLRKK